MHALLNFKLRLLVLRIEILRMGDVRFVQCRYCGGLRAREEVCEDGGGVGGQRAWRACLRLACQLTFADIGCGRTEFCPCASARRLDRLRRRPIGRGKPDGRTPWRGWGSRWCGLNDRTYRVVWCFVCGATRQLSPLIMLGTVHSTTTVLHAQL